MTSLNGLLMFAEEVSKETIATIKDNPNKTYFPFFGDSDNILNSGITIDRVCFTIPGVNFKVYWYGFLIAIGIVLALFYGYRKMVPTGLNPDKMSDAIIGGLIGAIFGARLYYVVFNDTGVGFKDFFDTRSGGLAIYGGLIGAVLVGGIIIKMHKQSLLAMLDICGPCFLIGQCIGRWGNFFNQEAFGTNTTLPWGMMSQTTISYLVNVSDDYFLKTGDKLNCYLPVHPCFLYESLWCLLGFVLLHLYFKHRKFDGEVFLLYIGWYGLGRFFIEGLRTDSLYLGNIRVSQLVAGTCVLASIVLIIIFRGMAKRAGDSKLYCQTEASKVQLAAYRLDIERTAEKKALKKSISKAKSEGKDFSQLQKEYDEKYGEEGNKAHLEKLKELKEAEKKYFADLKKGLIKEDTEEYESILYEDDEDEEDDTVADEVEEAKENENAADSDENNNEE